MRNHFSHLLTKSALKDERILLLTGDHGYALFDEIRREAPNQFINCGIAEQNMVGMAAGLAKAGFIPIVYGLAAFIPLRVLEQIKMDICYEGLKVILIGDGAGIVYGQLGASHQATEDLSAVRSLPSLDIHSPCDQFELEYCFDYMLRAKHASYFRFGKADMPNVHTTPPTAPMGNLLPIIEMQSDHAIIATGSMVSCAVQIAQSLKNISVYSAPVLAPFNAQQLTSIASRNKNIFTLEEHSVTGGLGSLVAEIISSEKQTRPTRVTRIGIEYKFSEHCGDYAFLMDWHGLSVDKIQQKILKVLHEG
jgi:transketolase